MPPEIDEEANVVGKGDGDDDDDDDDDDVDDDDDDATGDDILSGREVDIDTADAADVGVDGDDAIDAAIGEVAILGNAVFAGGDDDVDVDVVVVGNDDDVDQGKGNPSTSTTPPSLFSPSRVSCCPTTSSSSSLAYLVNKTLDIGHWRGYRVIEQ